jgi:uncharacterized protein (DUF2235 family)
MGRNIVILADGTGQRGGVLFDECRSNIYKLYRAARSAPDSTVDPAEQFSFYDPGIGTLPKGVGLFGGIGQWFYNLVCQATGLGLTENIVDCYAAIIRHWSPGDRIFLIGFSRGAYTARCVAAVLVHCGVPTRMKDGGPLRRDEASVRKVAREAVTRIYQHVSSENDTRFLEQRRALAARFRARHGSQDGEGSNAWPHFIGVFDTVAALSNTGSLLVVAVLALAVLFGLGGVMAALAGGGFWFWIKLITGLALAIGVVAYLKTHIKGAFGLPGFPWWRTLHLTSFRMKFYNTQLDPHVGWARHALAIDENRADFDRVPWGTPHARRQTELGEPAWFEQVWFAGNHSDIGGSYPESESRLSDISLGWMAREAEAVPGGLKLDWSVLRLYPDARGMQHDEARGLAFRLARRHVRGIKADAPLHESVLERFAAAAVLQYDIEKPYRPEALRPHRDVAQYYPPA